VVDFAPLSPALTDLITSCMRADPAERPPIATITHHPVIARARARGKDALVPEDERFLPDVLAGDMILSARPAIDGLHDTDVDMDGV
jgi:mitosis inhibitor protein kinase SWE1